MITATCVSGNYRRLKFNQRPEENRLTATSKAIRWMRIRWILGDTASHTLLAVNTACSKWVGLSRTVLFDKSSWESSRLLCDVFCTLHVPRSQRRRVHCFACATKIVMNVRLLWGLWLCMGILKLFTFLSLRNLQSVAVEHYRFRLSRPTLDPH